MIMIQIVRQVQIESNINVFDTQEKAESECRLWLVKPDLPIKSLMRFC